MSHTDEPGGATPPASTRNPARKRDAILDAMHCNHRAVGAVVAATAALCLNGALLSGFDTVARRGSMAEVAAQKVKPEVGDARQAVAVVQKNEVRMIELPPVQIVGRRLSPDVQIEPQMANQEILPAVTAAVTAGEVAAVPGEQKAAPVAPEASALAALTAKAIASPDNAGQGLTASRVGLLPNALMKQKPVAATWVSTQP